MSNSDCHLKVEDGGGVGHGREHGGQQSAQEQQRRVGEEGGEHLEGIGHGHDGGGQQVGS